MTKTATMQERFINNKRLFLNELLQNLERRFPEDGMKLLSNLISILNPIKVRQIQNAEVPAYGREALDHICDYLSNPTVADFGFQPDRARQDFAQFKQFAKVSPAPDLETFAKDLISSYENIYPDFAIMMEFYLCVPLNSVPAKRGFSKQNIQKTKLRNRLGEINCKRSYELA